MRSGSDTLSKGIRGFADVFAKVEQDRQMDQENSIKHQLLGAQSREDLDEVLGSNPQMGAGALKAFSDREQRIKSNALQDAQLTAVQNKNNSYQTDNDLKNSNIQSQIDSREANTELQGKQFTYKKGQDKKDNEHRDNLFEYRKTQDEQKQDNWLDTFTQRGEQFKSGQEFTAEQKRLDRALSRANSKRSAAARIAGSKKGKGGATAGRAFNQVLKDFQGSGLEQTAEGFHKYAATRVNDSKVLKDVNYRANGFFGKTKKTDKEAASAGAKYAASFWDEEDVEAGNTIKHNLFKNNGVLSMTNGDGSKIEGKLTNKRFDELMAKSTSADGGLDHNVLRQALAEEIGADPSAELIGSDASDDLRRLVPVDAIDDSGGYSSSVSKSAGSAKNREFKERLSRLDNEVTRYSNDADKADRLVAQLQKKLDDSDKPSKELQSKLQKAIEQREKSKAAKMSSFNEWSQLTDTQY